MDINKEKNTINASTSSVREGQINLLDYVLIVVKHKSIIIFLGALGFLIACGITLMLPNIYTATARILPPQEKADSLGRLLGGSGDLGIIAGLTRGGAPTDLYVGMLRSRSITDAIIKKFDLMAIYNKEFPEELYDILAKRVNISVGRKDSILSISVNDEDPVRAAAIANGYVDELRDLDIKLNLNTAGRERIFLEERLDVVRADLSRAEDHLQQFQESNRAIKLDLQAQAIIESISRLRGELASKEVEMGMLLINETERSPRIRALREGIEELKLQVNRLEETPEGKKLSKGTFIVTADVPGLGIHYARLMREYRIQETLFELLTRQYEMAKINEAKNTSILQVLDMATVPNIKSKPARTLIVLVATFVSTLAAVLFVFAKESLLRMPEEDVSRWHEIKKSLRLKIK